MRVPKDRFNNEIQVGDLITYPFRRYGQRTFDTNVARVTNIKYNAGGFPYLTTQIVSRNREWGTLMPDGSRSQADQYKITRSRMNSYSWNACKIPDEYVRGTHWELLINDRH